MGLFDAIKNAISGSQISEEACYEHVSNEVAQGIIRPGLWAKALAITGYDENKAKAEYLKLRVEALKLEIRENSAQQSRFLKELEKDSWPAYQRGDYPRAFEGFSLSAQKGQATAQYLVGFMCQHGQGIAQDISQAIYWYKAAAAQNNQNAQIELGQICFDQRQYDDAYEWFSRAEKNGHPDAAGRKNSVSKYIKAQRRLIGR